MKSLFNEEDVDQSLEDGDTGGGSSKIIKFDDGDNPIYILSPTHDYGFVHWVELDEKRRARVVCSGGKEGKGWAHEECMLCDFVRSKYAEARESNNKAEAEGLKNFAGRIKAKFEVSMIAAKGEMVRHGIRDKRGKRKYVWVPTFDTDDLAVGILQMSFAQYKSFIGLKDSDDFPYIKTLKQLADRPIIFDKKQRGQDKYKTVQCRPGSRKPVELPEEVEWDEEEYKIDEIYNIDMERIEEIVEELSGVSNDDDDDDSDIDDSEFYSDDDSMTMTMTIDSTTLAGVYSPLQAGIKCPFPNLNKNSIRN